MVRHVLPVHDRPHAPYATYHQYDPDCGVHLEGVSWAVLDMPVASVVATTEATRREINHEEVAMLRAGSANLMGAHQSCATAILPAHVRCMQLSAPKRHRVQLSGCYRAACVGTTTCAAPR